MELEIVKREVSPPKLTLNSTNAAVFQSVVIEKEKIAVADLKSQHKSNGLLIAAYNHFKELLADWIGRSQIKEDVLVSLERFIADNVNIIVIEVSDASDAFTIFETLNDRGMELAVADLVKNYLFSLASRRSIESFKRIWTDIAQIVGQLYLSQTHN